MAKAKSHHIVPRDDRWVVIGQGSKRASSIHSTQQEAIDAGRELARNKGGQLIIHRRDGQIREREMKKARPSQGRLAKERVVLFPTTPSTIGNEVIRKAVREVIQEIARNPE